MDKEEREWGCFYFLLPAVVAPPTAAEESGGQARLGYVMWHLCVVSRSIYTTTTSRRRRRHKNTRLLFSRYTAQQRLAHQHVPHTRSHRPWHHRPCRARNRHSRAQTRCAFFAFPFTYHSAHVPLAAQITILSKIPPNNSKLTCELCFGIISKWALH